MSEQRKGHGILKNEIPRRQGKSGSLFLVFAFLSVIVLCPEIWGASKSLFTGDPNVGTVPQRVDDNFIENPSDFVVDVFVENLEVPWELVFLPDGRALVTERPGRIRMIEKGKLLDTPYTTINAAAVGEGGLMGIALHPDYPDEPYLYVMYTYRDGGELYNRVDRLRDTGRTAVFSKVIVEKIPGARVHDGGRIAFGPDNMLYVCTGDATHPEIAQDPTNLGGKILRYTADGAVPKDNPFGNSPIYAYGLRNPQGLAWDPATRNLFSSEHGPSGDFGLYGKDSIKIIQKGGNYGWPRALGKVDTKPYVDPIIFWPRATPPAGMTFFRNNLYVATLKAEALIRIGFERSSRGYGVTSIERLFAKDWSSGKYGRLRGVVLGPDGNLYVLTSNRDGRGTVRKGDDKILKLTYTR